MIYHHDIQDFSLAWTHYNKHDMKPLGLQQSLPSAWADIFPMYKLLSNLIQPLMNGHLLNVHGYIMINFPL